MFKVEFEFEYNNVTNLNSPVSGVGGGCVGVGGWAGCGVGDALPPVDTMDRLDTLEMLVIAGTVSVDAGEPATTTIVGAVDVRQVDVDCDVVDVVGAGDEFCCNRKII